MGNYVSCTQSGSTVKATRRGTKVVFPSGEIRRLYQPTQAAELMLEMPNYFLVSAKSLQIGKRLAALNADQVLDVGSVYVFFPMKRLNSAVTAADIGALVDSTAKKFSLVLPERDRERGGETRIEGSETSLNLEGVGESSELKQRLSVCRSKKPLLETIVEEPVRTK